MDIAFGDDGLVPVVAQDHLSGEIRMLAYASREALERTLSTGRATFFSRSRNALWEKGETSGNGLDVVQVLLDCDADALIYLVTPRGPTCHTGAPSCFFRAVTSKGTFDETNVRPHALLARLEEVLEARKSTTAEASYVKSLYSGGAEKIGAKLREEAGELAEAVASEDASRVASEAADVIFHLMVALRSRDVALDDVLRELHRRTGTSGHVEKRSRTP